MRIFIIVLMAAAELWAADLDNNTLAVTATRPVDATPDQVSIVVQLTAAPDAGLDDVLATLKGTGITAANLTGVYQFDLATVSSAPTATWTFQTAISLTDLQSTIATLTQLQKTLGSKLSFDLSSTRPSTLPACPLTALVSDARKQAESMAAAAGMRVGPIVSLSDAPSPPTVAVTLPVVVINPFLAIPSTLSGVFSSTVATTPPPFCSLTVQFKLQ